jgi:hypothetical protein
MRQRRRWLTTRVHLKNGEPNLQGYNELVKQDSLAIQTLDNQQAAVDELNAQIANDQSAVEYANAQLSYTDPSPRLTAPLEPLARCRQYHDFADLGDDHGDNAIDWNRFRTPWSWSSSFSQSA